MRLKNFGAYYGKYAVHVKAVNINEAKELILDKIEAYTSEKKTIIKKYIKELSDNGFKEVEPCEEIRRNGFFDPIGF